MRIGNAIVEVPLLDAGLVEMNRLMAIRHHAIVRADAVEYWKRVIVLIKTPAPVRRSLTRRNRTQTASLHVVRNRQLGRVEKRLGKIEIGNQLRADAARARDSRPAH